MKNFFYIMLCFLMFCTGITTAQKKNQKKIVKYKKEERELKAWVTFSRKVNSYDKYDPKLQKTLKMGEKHGFYRLERIMLDSLEEKFAIPPSQIIGLNIHYGIFLSDEEQVSFFEKNALKYENLRYLIIYNMKVSPDVVFKLKNLRGLSLITYSDEIHKDIGNLQNLRYFDWISNDWSKYPNVKIPDNFYSLSKLTILYLYAGGKINMPKDFLKRMPNIKTLVVE